METARLIIMVVATLITLIWASIVVRNHAVAWKLAGRSKTGVVPAHVVVVTLAHVAFAVAAMDLIFAHPESLLAWFIYIAGNLMTWFALLGVGQYEVERIRAQNRLREVETRLGEGM